MLILKYYNPIYSIAFSNWREMYLLYKEPILLIPELYQGKLVYRARGSAKRISYASIKKGLLKKEVLIDIFLPF